MASETASLDGVDAKALTQEGRRAIFDGDGSDRVFLRAMFRTFRAFPQGHQSLSPSGPNACADPGYFFAYASRFGVCGRARGDEIVVTSARADNRLGLRAGERVVGCDGARGKELLAQAAERPTCGASMPSKSGLRALTANGFFGTVPAGSTLAVVGLDGMERNVVVPDEADPNPTSCSDALGRRLDFNARSYVRPDGVAVIQVPRWFPLGGKVEDGFEVLYPKMREDVLAAFRAVQTAKAIVWDMRANGGGITLLGLEVVAGMPSARSTELSYCRARIKDSNPLQIGTDRYAEYFIEPGGDFAYAGRTAVVIDGMNYSAADYFALAVKRATSVKLFGEATAGAFGASSSIFTVDGPPALRASVDANRCFDTAGVPLEGKGIEPDVFVEWDPKDVAEGRDTLLEAAVASVRD
jgi:hypothetical protein